jgi:hypothetical protein
MEWGGEGTALVVLTVAAARCAPRSTTRVVLAGALILVGAYFAARCHRVARRQRNDFCTYYLASSDAARGVNPYRDRELQSPYIYPPLLLWLVHPLTRLPIQPAAAVWAALTVLAWVGLVSATRRAVEAAAGAGAGDPVAFGALALPSLLALRPIWRELGQGQVNMVVAVAVAVGFLALMRRRETLAGAAIAFAAVLKVLPVAFLVPLVVWRRWQALAVAVVLVPVWLFLPVVTYGVDRYADILAGFAGGRLVAHARDLAMDSHMANQSLPATANRYLSAVAPLAPGLGEFRMNVADLPLEAIATGVGLAGVLMSGAVAWALAGVRHRRDLWPLGFSLMFVTVHLFSKKTWEEHLVSLVFVYTTLLAGSGPGRWRARGRTAVAVAAALQWCHTPLLLGRPLSDQVQALGPTTLALLVLWVHLWTRVRAEPGEAGPDDAGPAVHAGPGGGGARLDRVRPREHRA